MQDQKITHHIVIHTNNGENIMDISYSQLRQNLKTKLDQTSSTHEPIFITSHQIRKAVLLSYEDYESLQKPPIF